MSTKERLALDAEIVASKEQVSCDLKDDAVILGLEDGVYYGLNPVAARVWDMLERPRRIRDIRDRLLEEYEVTPERCTTELLDLLQELEGYGLIEVRVKGTSTV